VRAIVFAISCALFAGVAHAECVLAPPLESSGHIRISVVLGGKPLQGAKVIFHPSHTCTCASDALKGNPLDTSTIASSAFPMTDENGIANLPDLAPGEYDVAATIHDIASSAFIGLHVVNRKEVTTLPINLSEQIERVEAVPTRGRVEAFRGTVKDFAGAALPGASIVVVKKGSQAREVALTGKADSQGHFSGQVADGSYIAVFFSRAFRPAIVPFEVTKTGSSELQVSLNVQSCP
jgi:hypothetical protein